jgi:hypothetical protein
MLSIRDVHGNFKAKASLEKTGLDPFHHSLQKTFANLRLCQTIKPPLPCLVHNKQPRKNSTQVLRKGGDCVIEM